MPSRRIKTRQASCTKKSRAAKIIPPRTPLPVVRTAIHSLKPSPIPATAQQPKPGAGFASLDFPGRETLNPREVAQRIGCSVDHIYDLIFEGQLHAIDISGRNNSTHRRSLRVPIESWRKFLTDRTV
jgi:hypothetical protein